MSDLISREGAIRAIVDTESKVARETPYDSKVFGVMAKRQNEILDVLLTLPSAEPKTGRWVLKGNHEDLNVVCSECGREALFMRVWKAGKGEVGRGVLCETDYCPWCGSKMEVEE